jgi:hypothetical protein
VGCGGLQRGGDVDRPEIMDASESPDVVVVADSSAGRPETDGCSELLGENRVDRVSENAHRRHPREQGWVVDDRGSGGDRIAKVDIEGEFYRGSGDLSIHRDPDAGVEGCWRRAWFCKSR